MKKIKKTVKSFLFSVIIIFLFLTSFSGSQKTVRYTFTSNDLQKTEFIISEQNNNAGRSIGIAAIKTGIEIFLNKNISAKNKRSV